MKPIKLIHLADIHYRPKNKEEALASLRTATEKGLAELIDLFVIAGDLFDHTIHNSTSSGLPELQQAIQAMMDVAPVVAVRGTPTHDVAGCYEVLQETNAEHSFTVLDPRHAYFLLADEVFSDQDEWPEYADIDDHYRLLILGCPEPGKEWLLADKQMGSDEANEAIQNGMRELLLGCGGLRKEYPNIPCLFVYHGHVAGASMCNGQWLPERENKIGRDDLALVGFDYGALGHIHLAQQVGDLPAYYAGSAYPVDWGEVDQKGFYCVEFKEFYAEAEDNEFADHSGDQWTWKSEIQRTPFPHPPRIKLERFWPSITKNGEVKDRQAWMEVKVPRESRDQVNENLILTRMIEEWGALEGSKVTVSILPTETVRAGEIQEAKSLREKVIVYANNSSESISDETLDKADELEQQAREAGEVGEGLHIRINKLALRGAIGIQKGQGKDDIEVDLDSYDPGVIALTGPNGAGKTTLIENMHSFPEMLTRSGKLQDHFRLRDSWRDLRFADERTGDKYRAYISVDGANQSGKCEYYLYKNGEPITNGRKEDYENRIREIFGSLDLFLRSAFVTQKSTKNNPDLSDATKGERKAIFRELGGLDYLQHYSTAAKERADALENEILHDKGKVESLESLIDEIPAKERQLRDIETHLAEAQKRLQETEREGTRLKTEKDELEIQVKANEKIRQSINGITRQIRILGDEQMGLLKDIESYQLALEKKPEAEKTVREYEDLKVEEGRLHEQQAKVLGEREDLLAEYRDAQDIASNAYQKIDARTYEISQKKAVFKQKKAGFLTKIDDLQERLEQKVECPKCGNQFATNQEQDEAALKTTQGEVWKVDKEMAALHKTYVALEAEREDIKEPGATDLPEFDEARLHQVRAQFPDESYLNSQREVLRKAREAEVRIEEGKKRIKQIDSQMETLNADYEELEKHLDSKCDGLYEQIRIDLEAARERYIGARESVKEYETTHKALKVQIDGLRQKKEELNELQAAIKAKQGEISEWRYLERACGPDGIQALELDAMGPSIAEVANRLLEAAYGSRFKIEFRTTRIGGKGSKTKQIEDFQIAVLDSETGDEQLLETLSGGESVWIRRTLYDAFGIIRDRNTGQRFLTAFQDECDGALDPEARVAYFRMLEAAHQESGRVHTIVITHSESAQEMIAQKIEMGELASPVILAEQVAG